MTNVLAIDSATPQVSIALSCPGVVSDDRSAQGNEGAHATLTVSAGRRHAETLAPGIAYLTDATGVPLNAIDLLAADIGPGLFTGLRVGVATVKALAAALTVPVVGATSLDLLARAAHDAVPGHMVAAAVDARRGEVFWAVYKPGDDNPCQPPAVDPPEVVAARLAELAEDVLLVGDGACRYANVFESGGLSVAGAGLAYPDAAVLASIARQVAAGGGAVAADELHPCYLRQADVRIGWQQRG
jgi:tRNA threonylcarbamoyladenosine biosynthesis protein TsaB